jgi:hypothetical protein
MEEISLRVLDVGGKDGERARKEFYPGANVTVVDLATGWDVMKYGLPHGDWDVILANHFIEHVIDPDFFLDECKRVMGPETILDIGTPNLAAWFNRVLFMAGYVPHSVELSTRHNVGKAFGWNQEELGGHIRVFTLPALLDLLTRHNFIIDTVAGEPSTYPCHPIIRATDQFLTILNPNLASAFRVKCRYWPS